MRCSFAFANASRTPCARKGGGLAYALRQPARTPSALRLAGGLFGGDVGGNGGDGDDEARAALGQVERLDRAVVRLGDGLHDGKP